MVWLGYALLGGGWGRRIARCVLRGRAAMDAGNELGPEGAASLVPALERMTQLTSFYLDGARIRIGRGTGGLGRVGSSVRAFGYALGCDVVWLGYALEGGGCVRLLARCVLRDRAAMDAGNRIGPEGAASLAPALEKMPQLTLLDLKGARIRFWARPRGLGLVGSFGACCCCWVRAWMRCGVVGVLA